ncbi:MAG: 16S rRNA (guanine(527)-N(7))-methyltransferase RsmG [Anaerolineaceae bacterium]|nr:MAG: 16S rRNA (guanine(527)-N(7))-methyltransferase RsmG [Anaerolineaceae bacterium]
MDNDKNQGMLDFKIGLDNLDIRLNDLQMKQFIDYYELLIEKNKVMNLTAITEFSEVISKHFLDSLSIIKVYRPTDEKILDLGTGAGLPGIPLKIAFPDTQVVLMDSLNKRIRFLDEVIEKLDLNNITAVHGRAEDFGRDEKYREAFDICASRAVARLSILSEYCVPFVKLGGKFISYKSGNISEELKEAERAIKILGATVIQNKEFDLAHTDIKRSLIMTEKIYKTPNKYPRTSGKPSKEPL